MTESGGGSDPGTAPEPTHGEAPPPGEGGQVSWASGLPPVGSPGGDGGLQGVDRAAVGSGDAAVPEAPVERGEPSATDVSDALAAPAGDAPGLDVVPDRRSGRTTVLVVAAAAAVVVVVVVLVLVLGRDDTSTVTATPPATQDLVKRSKLTVQVPSSTVPEGEPVTVRLLLESPGRFSSAQVFVDGTPVVKATSVDTPLTFTPSGSGQHTVTASVVLDNGAVLQSPPVTLTVAGPGASGSAPPGSEVAAPPTTAPLAVVRLQADGLSPDGPAPLRFGMPFEEVKARVAGADFACPGLGRALTDDTQTILAFKDDRFVYAISQKLASTDGVSVGMSVDELTRRVPSAEKLDRPNGAAYRVRSADGSRELVYLTDGSVVHFIAAGEGDVAEGLPCR